MESCMKGKVKWINCSRSAAKEVKEKESRGRLEPVIGMMKSTSVRC